MAKTPKHNIYVKLDPFTQEELLSLLPTLHPLSIQIRMEQHNEETKAFRFSHEQLEVDVQVYVENGGEIHKLPPDPRPGKRRPHTVYKGTTTKVKFKRATKPKMPASLKSLDKELLVKLLKAQLKEVEGEKAPGLHSD